VEAVVEARVCALDGTGSQLVREAGLRELSEADSAEIGRPERRDVRVRGRPELPSARPSCPRDASGLDERLQILDLPLDGIRRRVRALAATPARYAELVATSGSRDE
jgi:hypothetical protein